MFATEASVSSPFRRIAPQAWPRRKAMVLGVIVGPPRVVADHHTVR